MADSSDDDDFGQKLPPLHIYLKRVLDKYPEGGQILKELVQNADDAEATKVIFLFDKSQHSKDQLWTSELGQFQGPALYAYNDAVFKPPDWYNIQHPEQSGKVDELTKVGRFGLGFISVYHLTDLPCILSGKTIGFLDPREKHFNYNPHTNTKYKGRRGKKWKLNAELLSKFRGQFSPFLVDLFRCAESSFVNGHFEGTIFRFPLRTEASEISKNVYTDDHRVLDLFRSFETDSELSLLFLKHVQSIEVYERGHIHEQPRQIFKVHVTPGDRPLLTIQRRDFLTRVPEMRDFHTVTCMNIEKQTGAGSCISRFITVNAIKTESTSPQLQQLISDTDLKLVPWMGVAIQVGMCQDSVGVSRSDGRVFCFLPLPSSEQTGLPVHVHGYFGLGDNRRGIKWPDRESRHDKNAIWNKLLATEVFPDVYRKVVLASIEKSKEATDPVKPDDVYRAWPRKQSINEEWSTGVKTFLQMLRNDAIFYTDHNGGCWMKANEVYVDTQKNPLLTKILKHKGLPVAHLPSHVTASLRWAGVQYQEITPSVIRSWIRNDPLQYLSRAEKLQLVDYVTSDTQSDLTNLYLLPLQDGTFTLFSQRSPTVYIASSKNPRDLIPNAEAKFAASDMPVVLKSHQVLSYTQLKNLEVDDILPLLHQILPSTWTRGTDVKVKWTPGCNNHPSTQWLTEMWNWLTKNQIPLEKFRSIPLIPMMNNGFLAKMQENRIIFRKQMSRYLNACLTEGICLFLENVGAIVLCDDLPSYITSHRKLDRFIQAPDPEGVLNILIAHRQKVNMERCVTEMKARSKNELRGLFCQLRKVSKEQKEVLKLLPLFLSNDQSFLSAKQGVSAVPSSFFGSPVKRLKKCRIIVDSSEDNLVSLIGIHKEAAFEFLHNNILPSVAERFYTVDESMTIMSWVLANQEYDGLVQHLKFIPTADDKLASPSELFEPSDHLLLLLGSANVFPVKEYSKGKLLNHLKRVGLKNDSYVTSSDVLNVATEVSRGGEKRQADVERAHVLLIYINRFPHLLTQNVSSNRITKPLYKFLEDLNWVPCEGSSLSQYPVSAGWYGKNNTLYSPRQVGLIESAMLQGSVVPLIRMQGIRQELLNVFNWSAQLDPRNYQKVENVVHQLKNVVSNFVYPAGIPTVSNAVHEIYGFLSRASDQHLNHLFPTIITSEPWVWHGAGFTTPDKMAITVGTLRIDLKPYLFTVPDSIKPHDNLLTRLGVRQTFQESALSVVLSHIQMKHKGEHVCNETSINSDVELVHSILRYITNLADFDSKTSDLLVPCRNLGTSGSCLYMLEASKCLYVDEERLMKQIFDENVLAEYDRRVIHKSISNDLAQSLGVQPLSHILAPSEAIDYGYDLAGPHETPINAIKRNLDMYKKGVDIFKELIQNADDAGATEVKFLIDWRRNEETASDLLSSGMKACHGPSIWAYNNARFSKKDITNICSIAAQSKKHKLDKVGRFGLGFTSVYHLTDVPSIVSGPYVLICDPRTTHLGTRIQPGQPGIKLDLTNSRHHLTLKSYPNQFQPYNGIFGCNLATSTDDGFDHTLIRLPLRTPEEANEQLNQLDDGVFDSTEAVKPLIESLKKASSTLLLFTQNVVHVSVHELDSKNPCEMKTVMSVTLERIQQMPRSISGQGEDMKTQRNLLGATAACKEDSSLPVPETTMIVKVTHETYASNKTKKKCSQFVVSSCMVQGEILDLAETNDGCRAGVLPCGGVAAELVAGVQGLTVKPVDGKAFSYLPLEVSTGLPFHVNGNFLLQPNRRQLWSKPSSSEGEFEARWNICLIKSVLSRALFNLLQDLQTLQSQNVVDARDFQSLWPRQSQCSSDFRSFVDTFYHTLGRDIDAPAVIFNGSQWVAVQDCFFTEWSQSDSEDLKSSVITLLRQKLHAKSWVELNSDVVSSIANVGANIPFDSNTFNVSRFLQEVFFKMLEEGAVESSHRDNIILHLLDLRLGERKLTDYDDSLKNTDCIPFSPDEDDLASPDRLVHPFTLIGSLYSENDILCFPHGEEYRREVRLLSLKDLGMACDDLPWDDVCERAESISMNEGYDQKIKNILRLIGEKLGRQDTPTAEQKKRIQNAKYLPVLSKPNDYPSVWCKSALKLMSAASLYESRHILLIGSVQPLLDEGRLGSEALNQNVKAFLGFVENEVKVVDVIKQLEILIKETKKSTQQTYSMAQTIYSFLQDAFCRDDDTDQNIDRLCSLRFILCEGEFRACKKFAFRYNGKSAPYLFEVPTDLRRFETLLRRCGVKQHFEIGDYLQVLHLLKTEFGDMALTDVAVRTAEAMTSEVVTICRSHQADDMQHLDIDVNEEMFVLDDQCILQKPSDLTYHDLWWARKSDNEVYTHDSLSQKAAETIGIKTTRQKKLERCSTSSGFESEFGQMENLTDRLSNILRSYPHVSDVLKELLQNADDAGATEIHFVYDPRQHKSDKVISNDWAGVQNLPALCVYNDKSFTEADIKGIQKVGVGGKREDISTTGRFGIGFNAVYHLTDCPSFLSNKDTLCVFDPLLKYTERADETCPGRRYNTNEDFRQNFPDMLSGYLEEEFKDLEGTMFRFPLRAKPSEISEECFSPVKVERLLDEFQIVSEEALLFLNNLKKITISRVNSETNRLEVKYSTMATFSDVDRKKRPKLSEHVKLFKNNPHEIIPSMCQVYSLVIQDSSEGKEKWMVSQMLGFEGVAGIKGSEDRLPRGGVAALLSGKRVESVQHRQHRAYCVLPLPIHTELPVHVNGMFELDSSRRNLSKGDDYAMEEQKAEDDDRLIHKWNRKLIKGVIAPAYAKLLVEAGKKIPLKDKGTSTVQNLISFYDDLFPKNLNNLKNEWHLVAKATLQNISQNNLEVLPVVCQKGKGTQVTWHHVNTATSLAYFDDLSMYDKPQVASSAEVETKKTTSRSTILRTFLLKVGFKLLASSVELCEAFQSIDVQAEFVSPKAVVKHLLCNPLIDHSSSVSLTETAFQDSRTFSTMFKYCLEGITHSIDLNGLPLRLTNDNKVGVFTTLDGLYVSSHCNVLPNLKQLFLHKELVHLCLNWLYQNKSEDEAYTSGIFKKFTISELAVHLRSYLPEDWQGCTHHVEWAPIENGHPPASWIRSVWEFICSETEKNVQTCLQPIQDWPLFPTTSEKLVSPAMSKTVLFLHGFCDTQFREKVTKVLQKLGVPELDVKHMPMILSTLTELLKNYLALPVKPDSVVDVIKFMLATDGEIGKLPLLESSDIDTLLQYLQEGCDSFSEENVQTIKMLPIFKLPNGKLTSLQSFEHCHTIEGYSLLEAEAETWMVHMNCVFLHPSRHLNLIHSKLGISPITHADVYLKFILPSFNQLTMDSKVLHLKNIEHKVMRGASSGERKAIIKTLSQISFIPDREGTLRTVEYFFDPDNAIFKAMVDPNKFLPEKMRHLTLFLSRLGLHTEVTQVLFVEFARTIESDAKAVTNGTKLKELCEASRLLTAELRCNKRLNDASFLRGVSKIKFIPSVPIKQELIDIHPAVSDGQELRPFLAYRGSMPERYVELVWSVAKLLPRWSIPSDTHIDGGVLMHDCLGIQNKVVIEKALSHTQQVCCRMVEKNAIHKEDTLPLKVRDTFKKVMSMICKYLQDNITDHGEELQRRLHHTALCLVDNGKVLIRADQMVFDMMDQEEESLRPYLYKAPRELSEFDALYKLLGAERNCTFDQLAGVLSTIKTECKDEILDPNEIKSALGAVTALFTLLENTKGKCKITVTELYLPSSNNLLRKASNLYYADPHLMDKMKLASTDKEFLIPLKQCGFDVNDEVSLIELLPESLRPKNLGNEMHENVCEDNEDCPAGQDCPYLEHIKRMVNSVEMTRVLLRLLQHQLEKPPDADKTKSAKLLQKFSNFCCKTELKLGLYDSNGALITSRPKSVPAYFNKDTMTIYLEHVCRTAKIRCLTFSLIAQYCGAVMGDLLDSEHLGFLQNALDCENPDGMNTILSTADIPEYDTGAPGSHTNRQYRLGALIQKDIRHLLDQDPYNRLYKGEIVGYERSFEDVHQAHENTASGSAGSFSLESDHSSDEDTEIVFAKIVEQIGESDASSRLSKQYRIDIGLKEPIIVKVTSLYKFLRPKEKPDLTVVPFTGDPTAEVPSMPSDEPLPDIFENYRDKIREEINEAFELPEEERKRAIRRLYRKWHPDKNPGRETLANEAFKFLKAEIERHENGSKYQEKYSQWDNDVRRDREDASHYQKKYQDHFQRNRRREREDYSTGFVPPSFSKDTPDPRSARLWFRQAEEHFLAAELNRNLPTHVPWIAFQIHQAAEMALKAAQFSLDGRPDKSSNDLTSLARKVCQHQDVTSMEVLTVVGELIRLGCDFSKPRKPQTRSSRTSGQAYKDFEVSNALKLCRELLVLVRDIVGIKVF
ncbi:LOW QUALITY PROTEIN: sacsin-like [Asterias rubens]|uniref:LOW QUALITY PROTEIN: sacsin-like n=1 Tax=Asterias rubens TaxID=7604 RepID=UPI001454EA8E|nr:LOW QUALITY PROTEIN: sacsin-like [Asterias rubens]